MTFNLENWANLYNDPRDSLYVDAIDKELTPTGIHNLFIWKNGGVLAEKKRESVEKNYVQHRTERPNPDDSDSVLVFLKKTGGPIWRIFWLHCLFPDRFPIYDQHAHRAMAKIEGWKEKEVPSSNLQKIRFYQERYRPAFMRMAEGEQVSFRELDKALWEYGKHLKKRKS